MSGSEKDEMYKSLRTGQESVNKEIVTQVRNAGEAFVEVCSELKEVLGLVKSYYKKKLKSVGGS